MNASSYWRDELPQPSEVLVGGGRQLPSLLFVTDRDRLAHNIGRLECQVVLEALRLSGHLVQDDVPEGAQAAVAEVHKVLASASGVCGVVLLGGYDVVPSIRVDCLPTSLRRRLKDTRDPDDFVVWNDDAYGDVRARGALGDLPVSRIPDGRSWHLVIAALQASPLSGSRSKGVRNVARPFADEIYECMPNRDEMLISEPLTFDSSPPGMLDGTWIYLMLHGKWHDGTRFWGERTAGGVEAINIGSVPAHCPAVVFAGCCWGALVVDTLASQVEKDRTWGFGPKTADSSLALRFLLAGATAFVGCTGSHYSPRDDPFDYFGPPMHRAFWAASLDGLAPAPALLKAKWDYAMYMPHGLLDPALAAIEYKILQQFTCLGIGW